MRACELLVNFKICSQSETLGFLNKNILSNSLGLSGGQTKQLLNSRSIIDPKMLILDEALSGVEQELEAEIYLLFKENLK